MNSNKCKICSNKTNLLFNTIVLKKYGVNYHQCSVCEYIQTDEPYWLKEAYSSAITNLDIGLLSRNIYFSSVTELLIKSFFNYKDRFVDFGGGYGVFVRLMRDKGFNFFRYDTYCENIFARNFDANINEDNKKFELLTCFEVFEHLVDPDAELTKMLDWSDNILFSTEIIPNKKLNSPEDWWYFAPETGQHISFFAVKSIQMLANKHSLNYYIIENNLHLLTRKKISKFSLRLFNSKLFKKIILYKYKTQSLMPTDFINLQNSI